MQGLHQVVEHAIKASRRIQINMGGTARKIDIALEGTQGIFGLGRDDFEDLAIDIEHTLQAAGKDLSLIKVAYLAIDDDELKRTQDLEPR
tara:strand:- start:4003 stop:4272 length:270 start_codon:yes stop_codon:yes gene_type:complete